MHLFSNLTLLLFQSWNVSEVCLTCRHIFGLFGYFFSGGSPTFIWPWEGPTTPPGSEMLRTGRKDLNSNKTHKKTCRHALLLTLYCTPERSQTLAQIPSRASISFIRWPLPMPPNDGLHDISPVKIIYMVSLGTNGGYIPKHGIQHNHNAYIFPEVGIPLHKLWSSGSGLKPDQKRYHYRKSFKRTDPPSLKLKTVL